MKFFKRIALYLLCLCMMMSSCTKELNSFQQKDSPVLSEENEMIQIGDKIEDPYRLENMQEALESLIADGVNVPINVISANAEYVRLLPVNKIQDSLLESCEDVLFFDFPLDCEIVESGESYYYHDSLINDSDYTWQYCVVPVGYSFPSGILLEKIYDVFIPDLDGELSEFYVTLEERSFEITEKCEKKEKSRNKWKPSAKIRVYDNEMGSMFPLMNVKVIVKSKKGSKSYQAFTNQNGECTINHSFREGQDVQYYIKWESVPFNLRHGRLGQAWTTGPQQNTAWNYDIYNTSKSFLYANVFRAAWHFFYNGIAGIHSPCMTRRTHIGVVDRESSSYCTDIRLLGLYADIVIRKQHNYALASDIISTTFHEIAHQSHMLFMSRRLYLGVKKVVYESWACAVEWMMLRNYYTYFCNYLDPLSIDVSCQQWCPNSFGEGITSCYTPIFIDLIDDYNQGLYNNNYPNDYVTGFSLQYIQDSILPTAYGLSSLYNSIINHRVQGVSIASIDSLFSKYWGQDFSWNP